MSRGRGGAVALGRRLRCGVRTAPRAHRGACAALRTHRGARVGPSAHRGARAALRVQRGARAGPGARRAVWAGLVAAVVSGWLAPPAAAQVALDVMTFNIRTSNVDDGADAWPHRRDVVVETIARAAPDILGLQEALDEQIEYLDRMLPDYRWLGVDRGLNGGVGLSEYTPIFYRHRELSPIASGNFWLTDTPDVPPPPRAEPTRRRFRRPRGRIVTWARFYHQASGREVYAFNTHLTLRQGPRQHQSARLIADRVAALPAGSAVVVTGDFNASAGDTETWRIATGRGLRDAWLAAGERRGPPFTSNGFGPPPPHHEVWRIDWILVGGPLEVRTAETVLYNEGGRYPSDHYPVAARLDWP